MPGAQCLWHIGLAAFGVPAPADGGPADRAPADPAAAIATAYDRFGTGLVHRLTGPFAAVLWDEDRQRLVLLRDRIGLYGLYYRVDGPCFRLAPAIEPLLDAHAEPNPAAVVAVINTLAPPPGETFYRGVRAVEPGALLLVERRRLEQRRYWTLSASPPLRLESDQAYAERLRRTVLAVVAEQRPSRPAAVTLSSGLDSASVAAGLRAAGAGPEAGILAVRWVTPELPEADEDRYSAATARALGLPELALAADRHWPLSDGLATPRATPFVNLWEPLWEATFVELSRRGIDCLFTGLSGDHLVGGDVSPLPDLLLTGRWRRLAAEVAARRTATGEPLGTLLRHRLLAPVANALGGVPPPPVPWLARAHHDLYRQLQASHRPPPAVLPGRLRRLAILADPLLPAIAEGLNRHAATHGIELRHPLLDHRLVELAARMPSWLANAGGRQKELLRRAFAGHLPAEVIDLHPKILPAALAHRGFRERETPRVWRLLEGMRAAELGFVDERRVGAAYRSYLAGGTGGGAIWYTITVEDWLRRHFA